MKAGTQTKWRLLAASVAFTALLLGAGELIARLARPTTPADEAIDHGLRSRLQAVEPCMRVTGWGARRRLVENAPTEAGASPRSVPAARAPGVTRIAFVGESNAWLFGERLRAMLDRAQGGRAYEVLNCGLPGGAMEPTARRFREVLGYRPDAVIVVFGHNYAYTGQPESAPPLRMQLLRRRSRLLSWLGDLLPAPREGAPPPVLPDDLLPPVPPGVDLQNPDVRRSVGTARFRAMMERMAARARSLGVPLVVTTMASNRLAVPAVTPAELRDDAWLDAHYLHDLGRPADAVAALAGAASATSAIGAFQLAEWRLAAGDEAAARAGFERAVALDADAGRASAEQNAWVRGFAARESLALRDPERVLAGAAPHGLPGWETFADCCHYVPRVEAAETRALFELARAAAHGAPCALPPEPTDERGPPTVDRFLRPALWALADGAPDEAVLRFQLEVPGAVARFVEVDGAAAEAPLSRLLDEWRRATAAGARRGRALAALAEGYRRAHQTERAEALNAEARGLPGGAEAWFQRARWGLGAGDRSAATEALARAAALDPARADVAYYRRRVAEGSDVPAPR